MSFISDFQFMSESYEHESMKWDLKAFVMTWNDKQYFHTILMDY